MACCDADGKFTMIETGYAGRNSDGGIFRASKMGQWLERNGLNLPDHEKLPYDQEGGNFPYYFVADEAFPLKSYLMRPYPKRRLNSRKRAYNYRLSRARKTVECAFGMMTQKLLSSPSHCKNENTINSIIHKVCILHNFICTGEGTLYESRFAEEEDVGEVPSHIHDIVEKDTVLRERSTAQFIRDHLCNYFLKEHVALPWQWKYCVNE
jgi:hypothetical protein